VLLELGLVILKLGAGQRLFLKKWSFNGIKQKLKLTVIKE